MHAFLAYAASGDQSLSNIKLVLSQCAAIAAIAIVAGVPIVIARRRRARRGGAILALAFFWAIFTAASVLPLIAAELNWASDDQQMIYSGYYPPGGHPAPALPWPFWIGLGIAYAGLILWSAKDPPILIYPPDEQHKGNGDAQA